MPPVGGLESTLIGATQATQVTTINPSLFQSGLFAKIIVGAFVSLFVTVATLLTVGVVVWRANYRSPGPVNDYFETWKNTPIEMAVLKNDKAEAGGAPGDEGDKTSLKLVSITNPLHGIAEIMASKKHVKYTPSATYAGFDTFQYVVTNGKKEAVGNVTLKVKNHAPEPIDDRFTLEKNIPASLDVLVNDVDIDEGDVLRIVSCTQLFEMDMGDTAVSPDGLTILWQPRSQYVGSASFAYTVSDGNDTATATVFLTVKNSPPIAEPDEYVVYRNTPTDLPVLENDHDPNGDIIEIIAVGNQDTGFLNFTSTVVNYTPKFNTTGGDMFEYTIWDKTRDNSGAMFTATGNVLVSIVNKPPFANDDVVSLSKNSDSVNILRDGVAGTDVPYATFTLTVVSNTQFGATQLVHQSEVIEFEYTGETYSYTKNTYQILYTPNTGFVGSDELQFEVSDDFGQSASGTITIRVINDPPTPADDFAEVARNSREGVLISVLLNDTDPNQDPLLLNTDFTLQPAHGRATYSGDQINYVPTSGFFGIDSFEYSISDVSQDSQSSIATVHIFVRNDPPVPYDDYFVVPKNVAKELDVLLNDVDPNQDLLTITAVADDPVAVVKGTKQIIQSNPPVVRYTPVSGQIYEERFQYTVSDGDSSFARTAWVIVNITNSAPVPVDEEIESHWTNTFDYDLIANDFDENGDTLGLTSIYMSSSGSSTSEQMDSRNVRVNIDYGGYILTTKPPTSERPLPSRQPVQKRDTNPVTVGTDFLIYTITDGQAAGTRLGQLTVIVKNRLPVPVEDQFTFHVDTWNKFAASQLLDNDYDDDSDPIRVTDVFSPYWGDVTFDGVYITFHASQTGQTSFVYRITDGCSKSGDQDGWVNVNVINDPPIAVDDNVYFAASLSEEEHEIWVTSNDYDPELPGTRPKIVISSVPAFSALGVPLEVDSDLRAYVIYRAPESFIGNDSFTYQVTDGHDVSNVATAKVNIVQGNPPRANPDVFSVHWRSSGYYFNVSSNDMQGDFPLAVSKVTPGLYTDSLTIAADNQRIHYIPKSSTARVGINDVMSYETTDTIFTVSATITAFIVDVPPVCQNDVAPSVHWRSPSSFVDARANDTDQDNDPIFITSLKPPQNSRGVASLGADNATISFTFNQGLDFTTAPLVGDKRVVTENVPYVLTDTQLSPEVDCVVTFSIYDRAPVAVADSFSSTKNAENVQLDVLANDYDDDAADGQYLSVITVTTVTGVASVISYNPLVVNWVKGFAGNAVLKYTITDGKLKSSEATVTISVANHPPTCIAPTFSVNKADGHTQTTSTFNLILNCTDIDGDTIELTAVGTSGLGTTGLSNNKATFLPTENRSGQTTISFTVTDRQDTANSTFIVNISNHAPVAQGLDESFYRNVSQYQEYPLVFSDVDNDPLTITGIVPSVDSGGIQDGPSRVNFTNGFVTLIGTKLRFTQHLSGVMSVDYTVTDSDSDNPLTASATAKVLVKGNGPIARPDNYVVNQGGSADFYVLSNDDDPDGDAIWIDPSDWLVGSAPTPAPVLMTDTNNVQFFRFDATSYPDLCSSKSFTYKIKSIDGESTALVSIGFTNCICKYALDVVYCVDSSGSITKSVFDNAVRPFLVNVTKQLDIGTGELQIRVGVVQFGSQTTAWKETNGLLTNPKGSKYNPGVEYVVTKMSYRATWTNTKLGLIASKELLEGGRTGVKKLIIVLTDGEYNYGGDPVPTAQGIYTRQDWRIMAIAVGDFNKDFVQDLVKDPSKDYFEVSDFDALANALQSVVSATCDG